MYPFGVLLISTSSPILRVLPHFIHRLFGYFNGIGLLKLNAFNSSLFNCVLGL